MSTTTSPATKAAKQANKIKAAATAAMSCATCSTPLFFARAYWLCCQSASHGKMLTTFQLFTNLVAAGLTKEDAFDFIRNRVLELKIVGKCTPGCDIRICRFCGKAGNGWCATCGRTEFKSCPECVACRKRLKAAMPKSKWLLKPEETK